MYRYTLIVGDAAGNEHGRRNIYDRAAVNSATKPHNWPSFTLLAAEVVDRVTGKIVAQKKVGAKSLKWLKP